SRWTSSCCSTPTSAAGRSRPRRWKRAIRSGRLAPASTPGARARPPPATHAVPGAVAPRTEGDLEAMQAAYEAGLVFRGDIEAPTILLDAYLEPELDMHNSRQKFAIRQRMLDHDGDASNLVLWALDGDDDTAMAKLVLK